MLNFADSPLDISLSAALKLNEPGDDGRRRFRMRAYDGGLLRVSNYPYPVVLDLATLKQAPQVKALLHHRPDRMAGHMDKVDIGSDISTEGVFDFDEAESEVVNAQSKGFQWEASVGCTLHRDHRRFVPQGQKTFVNGRNIFGPCIVASHATLREVSFVGLGAGEQTAALAASAVPIETDSMPLENDPPAEGTEKNAEGTITVTQEQWDKLNANLDTLASEQKELKAQAKRQRIEALEDRVDEMANQYDLPQDSKLLASLKEQASAGEIGIDQIDLAILRASAQGRGHNQSAWGRHDDDQRPTEGALLEAAFLVNTVGYTEDQLKNAGYSDNVIEAAYAPRFEGFGLQALTVNYLRANGHYCHTGQANAADIQAALRYSDRDVLEASASTVSLPGVLRNVAHKQILQGRNMLKETVADKLAHQSTTKDFKKKHHVRLTVADGLKRVSQDGKLEAIKLSEEEYTSQAEQWGRSLVITEKMWANDDGHAFAQLPRQFGYISKISEEQEFLRVLLNNVDTKFTTAKGNRITDEDAAALSIDSLKAVYKAGLSLDSPKAGKDGTKHPIYVDFKYLLVGPNDAILADQLYTDTTIVTGEAKTKTSSNPHRGRFKPLVSRLLRAGKVTNATDVQFLAMADPALFAAVIATYRNGRRAPQIRNYERIPGQLGMQWDIVHEFNMDEGDEYCAIFSKGSA